MLPLCPDNCEMSLDPIDPSDPCFLVLRAHGTMAEQVFFWQYWECVAEARGGATPPDFVESCVAEANTGRCVEVRKAREDSGRKERWTHEHD
jgi:hypothetical protein